MPVGKVAALYLHYTGTHSVRLASLADGLDAVGSMEGGKLYVHVVNTERDRARHCVPLVAGKPPRSVRVHRLSSADPFAEIRSRSEDPVRLEEASLCLQ